MVVFRILYANDEGMEWVINKYVYTYAAHEESLQTAYCTRK